MYTLHNAQDQAFIVYCEFHHGFGYTFVDLNSSVAIDPSLLFNNHTAVVIRDLRKDGSQREAVIAQISNYRHLNFTVQYNSNVGYNTPLNAKEKPYLYLGLLPINGISHRGDRQGYNLNGHDVAFSNCDGNPNSYFAFYGNLNHLPNVVKNPSSALLHQWVDQATQLPTTSYIPASFFTGFEIHMGGCGAYGTLDNFQELAGAALGLRYGMSVFHFTSY